MTYVNKRTKFLTGAITRFLGAFGLMTAVLFGAVSFSNPAEAQVVCVEHNVLVKKLKAKHSEKAVAMGLASTGAIIQIFSAKEGDTWTLVRTAPDGTSCVMAVGEAWMDVPMELAGDIS